MVNTRVEKMSKVKKDKLLGVASLLFCFFAVIDPANSIFGVKVPTFLFLLLCLFVKYRPSYRHFAILGLLITMQLVSFLCGTIAGFEFNYALTTQFFIFFVTLYLLCWDYAIDFELSIMLACVVLSVITIIGSIIFAYYPEMEVPMYEFSKEHNTLFLLSKREFLGVEFKSFFYRSLPLVVLPASIYFNKLLTIRAHRKRHLLLSVLFLSALFCGGNRAMLLGMFSIITITSYSVLNKNKFFRLLILLLILVGFYIAYLAITEVGETSSDIKFGHIVSYREYFPEYWYTLFFGTGAGSMFYSDGFGEMTAQTEWTYIEIVRMYGIIGLLLILLLLFKPLFLKPKGVQIENWSQVKFSYLLYMFLAGSNPNLFCSTGLICIVYFYSYVSNPKYIVNHV